METKEVIQNYWDYRSDTYNSFVVDQSDEERNTWMTILSEAMDNRDSLKVLDVGTGPGFLALICAEMGHNVTAVDLSENMVKKAKENALKRSLEIDVMQGDAENLELPDSHFDVVMNKYLLWTLPEPGKALMEWKRILKQGGMIIAIDGDWHNDGILSKTLRKISNAIKVIRETKYPRIYNKHYDPLKKELPLFSLKPDEVKRYFKEAGFEDVNIERIENPYISGKKRTWRDKLNLSEPVYMIKARKQ
ncbi:class I SAM-dependent methyltransferase [Methanolobus bombayensis]|uniref:class I SAM-dependent methyltransferase n=1 Tax=Methanolobus bombayensis TaxID=38023 RepID=UPI001AE49040|nr:class I SAM-dependent methyltransferase [Methanolobus bombayensis]MBP1908870.1 ubiquinone/menaquinone biosynthesis C-methylase UbiE [Methanolobus bombayensis]